jgi:hypothetical protein
MSGCSPEWTVRQHVAHWIHQVAFKFDKPVWHTIRVADDQGDDVFSVAFEGGFCFSEVPPYTAEVDCLDDH